MTHASLHSAAMRLGSLILLSLTLASVAVNAENGEGDISGVVRLVGPVPNIPTVMPQTDFDACGSEARPTQSLLLGAGQTVHNAIVYLGGYSASSAANRTADVIVLDQRNCEFVPRIQIAHSGAPLVLKNSDPVLHVVQIVSMSSTNGQHVLLKVATPYAGYQKTFQLANFREPTLLQATANNGHEWMAAYIAVMPHPWAALTDENGRFTLHNVPAGAHKIYAWHEVLGTLAHDVQVESRGITATDFQFTTTH